MELSLIDLIIRDHLTTKLRATCEEDKFKDNLFWRLEAHRRSMAKNKNKENKENCKPGKKLGTYIEIIYFP